MEKKNSILKEKIFEDISIDNQKSSLNSRFPITWLDILTQQEIDMLHANGIRTLDHLRCYFNKVKNISAETKEKLIWAKDFYNLTPCEKYDSSDFKTINSKYPIFWLNIAVEDLNILCKNNIITLEQLRNFDLQELKGISESTLEQLTWARDFYNVDGEKPKQYKKAGRKRTKKVTASK